MKYSDQLHTRPINPLINALNNLGADIKLSDSSIEIVGCELEGKKIEMDADESSQYFSALMLIAPSFKQNTTIQTETLNATNCLIAVYNKIAAKARDLQQKNMKNCIKFQVRWLKIAFQPDFLKY